MDYGLRICSNSEVLGSPGKSWEVLLIIYRGLRTRSVEHLQAIHSILCCAFTITTHISVISTKPDTMESLKTLREAPALASLIKGDETTISRALESSLSTITHTNGMVILDEYFPKSAIDLRPLNRVVPDKVPTSIADTVCRDSPFVPLIQSHALEALTVPTSVSLNAVSLKALGILERTCFARRLVLNDVV
jgi:hypothetical protein